MASTVEPATTPEQGPVDVTVTIVTWNGADLLARCLDSLARGAAGLSLQAVVVDNASRDRTREVLAQRPWVEAILNERNAGVPHGRNQAIRRARGRAIVTLDQDTVAHEGSIATMVRYLDEHPRVGLVGARLLNPDGSLQRSCRRVPPWSLPFRVRPPLAHWLADSEPMRRHLMEDFAYDRPRAVDWLLGACHCFRAALLPRVGAYDERIFSHGGDDLDWCLRIWRAGYEVHFVPDAEVTHVYGHFTRRHPWSKQALRVLPEFYWVLWKNRDFRHGAAPA